MSSAATGRPPTFIIIGGMKCGTTSMHSYIGRHPDAFISDPKELDFFCKDANFARGPEWYFGHFATTKSVRGEASPNYMKRGFAPAAAPRAAALLPDVQLVCLFRHPVDRLISHHGHAVASGRERRPLNEFVRAKDAHTHLMVDAGRYCFQLEPWLERYPREQFWFGTAEDLGRDHLGTVRSAMTFLGLDPTKYVDAAGTELNSSASIYRTRPWVARWSDRNPTIARAMSSMPRRLRVGPMEREVLEPALREWLMEQYASDIAALEQVVGRSMAWD